MKYRLKDRRRQQLLDELSGGDFTKQFEKDTAESGVRQKSVFRISFGEKVSLKGVGSLVDASRFSVVLASEDVEEFYEYDPHRWNQFPETTPPEGVLMRCEYQLDGRTCFAGLVFERFRGLARGGRRCFLQRLQGQRKGRKNLSPWHDHASSRARRGHLLFDPGTL